jgi:hypothetical protein
MMAADQNLLKKLVQQAFRAGFRSFSDNGYIPKTRCQKTPMPIYGDWATIAMNNRNVLRGVFLLIIALAFGLGSLNYSIGKFSRAGPGLFPLMVSCLLFVIGLFTLVRARFLDPQPMDYNLKNIGLIMLSLCGFAAISHFVNVSAGIVFLVFCSSYAASSHTLARNIKVSVGLILVALMFQKLLGLNLPLY